MCHPRIKRDERRENNPDLLIGKFHISLLLEDGNWAGFQLSSPPGKAVAAQDGGFTSTRSTLNQI